MPTFVFEYVPSSNVTNNSFHLFSSPRYLREHSYREGATKDLRFVDDDTSLKYAKNVDN